MRSLLFFVLLFLAFAVAQVPNLAPLEIAYQVSATQFTYNRWLDYIFNNGATSNASAAATANFYNAVDQ